MEELQALHVNAAFFFYPSQHPDEAGELTRQCREKGISVFTEDTPRGEPFTVKDEKGNWRLIQPLCVNGPFCRLWADKIASVCREFAPDSMGLCPDEFYWSNSQLGYTCRVIPSTNETFYCACSACTKEFCAKYGQEFLELGRSRILQENTPANRAFILFRYESVARAFREWMDRVKAENSNQNVCIVLSAVPQYALERYPSGICWDILGKRVPADDVIVTAFPSSFDYRGPRTHYWITETVKHLVGAFKNSRAGIVCNLYDCNLEGSSTSIKREMDGKYIPVKVRPVDVYGNIISCIANGAKTYREKI